MDLARYIASRAACMLCHWMQLQLVHPLMLLILFRSAILLLRFLFFLLCHIAQVSPRHPHSTLEQEGNPNTVPGGSSIPSPTTLEEEGYSDPAYRGPGQVEASLFVHVHFTCFVNVMCSVYYIHFIVQAILHESGAKQKQGEKQILPLCLVRGRRLQ